MELSNHGLVSFMEYVDLLGIRFDAPRVGWGISAMARVPVDGAVGDELVMQVVQVSEVVAKCLAHGRSTRPVVLPETQLVSIVDSKGHVAAQVGCLLAQVGISIRVTQVDVVAGSLLRLRV